LEQVKWIELRAIYESDQETLAMEIISNCFFEMGVKGVVEEDPLLQPTEKGEDCLDGRIRNHAVTGYFPKDDRAADRLKQIKAFLHRLGSENSFVVEIVDREIDEEDWSESWKAYFHPMKLGERIIVKPTWSDYPARPDDIILEIDPGMAFGTGTHPTTAMCIMLLEKYIQPGMSFLDIGTGSGILMVAAEKFGAARLMGIERDPVAVGIAEKNLLQNNIPQERFSITGGDFFNLGIDDRFGCIAANILLPVILDLLESGMTVLEPEGIFIASGVLKRNRVVVIEKLADADLELVEVAFREEWMAVVGKRT
jgi:ribosomal protein L11 methyltransferase